MYVMTGRTDRIEVRVAPERVERIRRGAALAAQSVSAFVVGAAEREAERLIAVDPMTLVDAEYFDQLYAALDAPDVANPRLSRAAKRVRRDVTRR